MKLLNAAVIGLGGWAAYELYKNHTINATTNAMKNDIMAVRNKVAKLADEKMGNSTTPTCGPSVNINTPTVSASIKASGASFSCGVTGVGGSAWTNYVGQPRFTQNIIPSDPNAVNSYAVSYFDIFRKQPTAFSSYMHYK